MKIELLDREFWIKQIQTKRAAQIKHYEEYLAMILKENFNWFTKDEYAISFAESYLEDAKDYYRTLEEALKNENTGTIYLSAKEFSDLN